MSIAQHFTPLSKSRQIILAVLSFAFVAFGQPAWIWWFGLIAAAAGYALFWRVLLCYPNPRHRFWMATAWFSAVQLVQLSWFISHPFAYIYGLLFLLSLVLGMQFGALGILITPETIRRLPYILAIAGLWTIFEWLRLFFFAGFTWNPIGLALTGNLYALQMASLWGVFGLSFWVIFVNLLLLRAWQMKLQPVAIWTMAAALPYLFGVLQLQIHTEAMEKHNRPPLRTLLVQTAFPVEETFHFADKRTTVAYVLNQWRQILQTAKKYHGEPIDLMVLPEYVVLCGTYSCVFPIDHVKSTFHDLYGPNSIKFLPPLEEPFARTVQTPAGETHLVNNAFWVQGLANLFQSGVVIGLEDVEETDSKEFAYYSSARYFQPYNGSDSEPNDHRYDKRVLLPFGEYIPFEWCRDLAARYGVKGSFTHGKEAKVFTAAATPFGLSICYEETFGNLMRENKLLGAGLLVNLTSDVWYPHSRLPWQHLDHARLRTVENGFPLIRASNIGLTGVVDSLGRTIALAGIDNDAPEWSFEALKVNVPVYTYQTLYSQAGDALIITVSVLCILFAFLLRQRVGRT